jgi:hypothetical protein
MRVGTWSSILAATVAATIAVGCGIRTNPLDHPVLPGTSLSSCDEPEELVPLEDTVLRGSLSGSGEVFGWCGADDGIEDVYVLDMQNNRDLTLRVLDESEFVPTIRVEEDVCGQESARGEGLTRLCTSEATSDDPRHVLLLKGHRYFVTIDSTSGSGGNYAVEITWANTPLSSCDPHPETIVQAPGTQFLWNNSFSRGQGRVDSQCGGPGQEDMFKIRTSYTGYVWISVNGSNGFLPLVSLRRGCGGVTEMACSPGLDEPATAYASIDGYFLDEIRDYYVVVDQVGVDGGRYDLAVYFD